MYEVEYPDGNKAKVLRLHIAVDGNKGYGLYLDKPENDLNNVNAYDSIGNLMERIRAEIIEKLGEQK